MSKQSTYYRMTSAALTSNKKITSKIVILLTLFFSCATSYLNAQSITPESASGMVKEEQQIFLQYIHRAAIDSNISNRLTRFIVTEADSIRQDILHDATLNEEEKVKGIRSIVFVMKALRENLELQKPDMYDIPGALESFKQFLNSMLHNSAYAEVLKPLGQQRSQLLANTFWQCNECSLLNDITVYKRLASAPDYILQNLEKNPGFYFRDSLLLMAAAYNPVKMGEYLRNTKSRSALSRLIRNNPNRYIHQIVLLADDRNAADLLPFVEQLADGKLTVADILAERSDVNRYFQLLVNTLKTKLTEPGDPNGFDHALQRAVEEKSMYFYVRSINELHEDNDNSRFAAVKGMRPEDLYYMITSSGEDLYTSSYLGLYKRMMEHFKAQQADSLFRLVQYDRFHKFIRLAANYNVLGDFLKAMPPDSAKLVLQRFISGIENDTQTGIEKAMDIADLFTVLASSPEISNWIQNELLANYERCRSAQQFFGSRLYNILLQVFDLVKQNDPGHKLWATLGNHETLDVKSLRNEKGEIVELVLFYGDKDGVASYNSFMALFKDTRKWEITKNDLWITIRSVSEQPIVIYANLPLDNDEQKDLAAQEALSTYLAEQAVKPAILIHRGHSYHLEHTFKRLQPSMKLVLVGSCGGYNNNLSIANFSPDAQIILTKKVGSKSVNDPMIEIINDKLLNGNNLVWTQVWEEMTGRFKKDPFTLNLFNEYLPPSKNVNLFVLKLFNYAESVKNVAQVTGDVSASMDFTGN
jgi:hypothetical protein